MLLRSGFSYEFPAAAATTSSSSTSTRCGRKRKSVDDELDERPLKRQETTLVLQGEPSGSHPFPLVAPPSSSNPPSSPPPPSELPFTREDSCDSDATVAIDDDNSSVATVALEDDHAGDERGPRRVHFNPSVIEYLFEVDDEPRRVVDARHFAYLHCEDMQ